MNSHSELAFAKLTVHLRITGVRADGFHFIDSEMVSLDLADELFFEPGDGLQIEGNSDLPTDHSNLVTRALTAAGKTALVHLRKHIPAGGGLGGGSSDAAAALRWAQCGDLAIAAAIGADVPFCLSGGRAQVSGIGDRLLALDFEPRAYTLLVPPFGVDTASVYRAFDATEGKPEDWSDRNHLQAAALAVEPRLREWKEFLNGYTKVEPCLAGSGSTWFVEGEFVAPTAEALKGARWINARTVPAII